MKSVRSWIALVHVIRNRRICWRQNPATRPQFAHVRLGLIAVRLHHEISRYLNDCLMKKRLVEATYSTIIWLAFRRS
jgi:hypothetical protein